MKYIEVYEDIKKKINMNVYTAWGSLDGEEILCKKYQCSRPTVRKAIEKLKQEGYVHTKQGSGVFINPPEFYTHNDLKTISERFSGDEYKLSNKIISFEHEEANSHIAKILNINTGDQVYHFKRLRLINDLPYTVEDTYMPVYLFPNFKKEALYGSIMRYIEKEYQLVVSHDTKVIRAIITGEELAKLLEIDSQQPILSIEHTVYLTKSIPAQYTLEVEKANEITIASVR